MRLNTTQFNRIITWAFPALCFLLSFDLPFWGDGIASVSKAAVTIYERNLTQPWNLPDADPGHPTLFPFVIALCWKLFGFQLWVPHLLVALMLGLCLREIQYWSNPLPEEQKTWVLLLAALSPLTVSQGVEISLQMPLTLLFLISARMLRKGNYPYFALAASGMLLIHLQGVLLLGALFLWQAWRLKFSIKPLLRPLFWWLLPALVLTGWMYAHYQVFGWALSTPNYGRAVPSAAGMLYNLGIMAWRLLDLGYFILLIPAVLYLFGRWRKKVLSEGEKLILTTALVLCVGIPLIFAYPPSHRYIFPVYLFLPVLFVRHWQKLADRKKLGIYAGALLVLLSGHLWYYPGKCLGDQNLVFLNYHRLEKQMLSENPGIRTFHSFAPLNNDRLYTYLRYPGEKEPVFQDLYDQNFQEIPFILESNLNCEFTPQMRQQLDTLFVPRTYQEYGVYLTLWINKSERQRYPQFEERRREKGKLETWIETLKRKLKG